MTNKQFDKYWKTQTADSILNLLGKKLASVSFKNDQSYAIENREDLVLALQQELYEELTGREV